MSIKPDLKDYLVAGYPCIFLRTHDIDTAEKRIDNVLSTIALHKDTKFGTWKVTSGLVVADEYMKSCKYTGNGNVVSKSFPDSLLYVQKLDDKAPTIAVFHNVRQFLGKGFAANVQQLLDTISACRTNGSTIILVGAALDIPLELMSGITVCDCPLPTKAELKNIYKEMTKGYMQDSTMKNKLSFPKSKSGISQLLEDAAKSALGLDDINAENAFALSISMVDKLDIKIIQSQKEQEVSKSDVLEFIDTDENIETIGGFTYFKEWLETRKDAFSDSAREYGLTYPKGALICGIHGTGKSLAVKCAASYFGIPLLRLDMSCIFKSYLGESEESIRNALRIADAVAPNILWIDELDKNMAGSESSGNLDSGVTARVISTLLTWRQETKSSVIFLATANSVDNIPSMMYRKGRLDEIWFVDLPSQSEREVIFEIHLLKKKRDVKNFDCRKLAIASDTFCGSEIESMIDGAMFTGYSDNKREFTTEDILKAINITIPQAVRDKEEIDKLRKWGKERARPVSDTKEEVKVTNKSLGRSIRAKI